MNRDPLGYLAERRERVERELVSATGNTSLCSISKSAGSVPGVKYLEGRLAAVMEVARLVRRGGDGADVAEHARSEWSERLTGAEQRAMGADWTGYFAGGVDELEEISSALRDLPPG